MSLNIFFTKTKYLKVAVFAVFLFLLISITYWINKTSLGIYQDQKEIVKIDKTYQGQLPFTVSLDTDSLPQVSKKMAECEYSDGWYGESGNGLGVNWGDGYHTPNMDQGREELMGKSCTKDVTTHIYTVPGTYSIIITSWHPGPTDGAVIDWKGSMQAIVTGKGEDISLDLKLMEPKEIYFYQEFPQITWDLKTNQKVSIFSKLVGSDGKIFRTINQENIAYNGTGFVGYWENKTDYENYEDLLRQNKDTFSVLVEAQSNGQVLAKKEITNLKMTARANPKSNLQKLKLSATSKSDRRLVEIKYDVFHPECFGYELNWGDGSQIEKEEKPKKSSCLLASEIKTFQHIYKEPGKYTIQIKTNEYNSLEKTVVYQELEVVVN